MSRGRGCNAYHLNYSEEFKIDYLPEDAWVPFLKEVEEGVVNSTQLDFRAFSVKEQQQLLLVGACLNVIKMTLK